MILRPQQTKTIARQIGNHLDSNTYYVQAKVRNSLTDELLATVNLDDKGGQRFTGNWLVAQDSTGLGFDIDITTSVYTDSGYTTKSANYADETNEYRVEVLQTSFGGGGGADINYKRVREIIKDELDKLSFPATDTSELDKLLRKVLTRVNVLPDTTADYSENFDEIKSKIDSQEKPEKVNLEPIIQSIDRMAQAHDGVMREMNAVVKSQSQEFAGELLSTKKTIQEMITTAKDYMKIKDQLKELNKLISDKPYIILNQPAGVQKEEVKRVKLNLPKI